MLEKGNPEIELEGNEIKPKEDAPELLEGVLVQCIWVIVLGAWCAYLFDCESRGEESEQLHEDRETLQ